MFIYPLAATYPGVVAMAARLVWVFVDVIRAVASSHWCWPLGADVHICNTFVMDARALSYL